MPPIRQHAALLLLPPPPSPATFESLKAAYNASLLTVLREASQNTDRTGAGSLLEIALPCPHLYDQQDAPRSTVYEATQRLLANLYKLICVICAKDSINVEDASGIDVRILLVAYPRSGKQQTPQSYSPKADDEGPVISLQALARSGRRWNQVYVVETEEGEQLLKNFRKFHPSSPDIPMAKVRGGIVQVSSRDASTSKGVTNDQKRLKHSSVAVGGTFDHLHIGHKLLLSMTAFMLDGAHEALDTTEQRTIVIGITGDELLKNKKYADHLESWSARQQYVDVYMRSILDFSPHGQQLIKVKEISDPGPNGHAVHVTLPSGLVIQYVEIWDPFGPTITDQAISALVLSGETRSGGAAVNSKREEKKWPALEVFEVDVLDVEEEFGTGDMSQNGVQSTFQSKLSSTEIRKKLSERGGRNKI